MVQAWLAPPVDRHVTFAEVGSVPNVLRRAVRVYERALRASSVGSVSAPLGGITPGGCGRRGHDCAAA